MEMVEIDRELFGLIAASVLAILSLMMAVWMLFCNIYDFFTEIFRKKKNDN